MSTNDQPSTAPAGKKPKINARFLSLGNLLLPVLLVIIALHWGDGRVFAELLLKIKPQWLVLAALCQIGTYLCVTMIWRTVFRRCGIPIRSYQLFALSIAKLFFDQTLPSFGVSGSVMAMRGFIRRQSSKGAAAAAVIINTTSRYLPYVLLFTAALAILWKHHMLSKPLEYTAALFIAVIVMLMAAIPALVQLAINHKTPSWVHRFGWLEKVLKTLREIPVEIIGDWRLWLVACLANACIFLLDSTTLWSLLSSLGIGTHPWFHAYVSDMVSSVVTDLAMVPGKIGVFEGSSVTMLRLFKYPLEEAVAATLLFRGFTYWLPMIPGFIITRRELGQHPHESR
ncbi:MAG TPA: lysylphosphatidylglycerol synthase transmembrane domain-containing protein [Verrucomicrobiae bacterium]|jgi:uncharacterized protein (TIRG00374 family)|nr:lysylphosphatidylglycerol synthase transmembrane domain-containing protein [Verrucomicrobiae bacterium]